MKKSWKQGFTLVELTMAISLVTSVPLTAYQAVKKAREMVCENNLAQIWQGLTLFMIDTDQLPDACFYPEKPDDPRSISRILSSLPKEIFICPAMPEELKKKGLTYIWNDECNGKKPDSVPNAEKIWLMTEMSAVSDKAPPPHSRGYNILYLDGHVATSPRPPELKPRP